MPSEQYFSHIMVRTSYILCDDDDDVYFVLDQHAELDIYSASSLKQQTVDRHVTPLGHNFRFQAKRSLFLHINAVCLAEKQQLSI